MTKNDTIKKAFPPSSLFFSLSFAIIPHHRSLAFRAHLSDGGEGELRGRWAPFLFTQRCVKKNDHILRPPFPPLPHHGALPRARRCSGPAGHDDR